ncbi:MAG: hypothetical protein MUE85_01330 [Microscillaceae bacterium]|jgi:hypothetical protein|nr:hypothetical protein [Microscillaceae bacterium]
MELGKSGKKIAREIIEKGLQAEFANGLEMALQVLKDWQAGKMPNREAYHTLYKSIIGFDKHIAQRYDRMSGSDYFWLIEAQLIDGLIQEADLQGFAPEVRQKLIDLAKQAQNE